MNVMQCNMPLETKGLDEETMDQLHDGIYSCSDGHTDHLMEMYCQGDFMESYDDKKLKRRESDAKCRANITAGFDLLKEQVYASGSQEKVSKEAILHQSFVRIKYLEGVLVALQQTKEISNGTKEKLQKVSPLQQLRDIHHQFVAFQQRRWSRSLPTLGPAKDSPRTSQDRQGGIRRMTKRRRPKHKSLKKSPILAKRKKCSPVIHLPPARHTPSRPQKRIKLASTNHDQDQVVPLCSILHPTLKIPHPSSTRKGTGRGRIGRGRAGSQTVPYSPQGRKEDVQHENLYTNETGAPSSPMIDVCTTPCKLGLLRGSSLISTPMKTYQIIGTSITPVKIAYNVESPEDSEKVPGPSPDLVCDEEPTSWAEDDISSSSGSIPELHISHPWFSTPARPTGLPTDTQTPVPSAAKHQRPPSRPPVLEPQVGQKEAVDGKREGIFKENANGVELKSKCTTPRKKYRKRATAARVRAWDSATGRVLSPVQPYSGVFKAMQQRKIDLSSESRSPAGGNNSPWGYLGQKLSPSGYDAPIRPMSSIIRERLVDRLNSDIVYMADFTEESDEEIIDLLGTDSPDVRSSRRENAVPTPSLDHNHDAEDSSPACLRDVSIPPPTGTISPPSLARHSSMGYDESPELFKGFRSLWVKDTKGDSCIAVEMDCYQQINNEEAGFYDYHHQTRCDPDDAAMMEKEDDLFEADLGDTRHLDPALQPPSSSLDSEDYIVPLRRNALEELDRIDVVRDADETCGSSRRKKRASTPALLMNDGLITPALASFATSALSVKHTRRTNVKGQRRRRNVRLNLPKASTASSEEEDDLNIWKFTRAALNEKDVFGFLPTDTSYALITNDY